MQVIYMICLVTSVSNLTSDCGHEEEIFMMLVTACPRETNLQLIHHLIAFID